MAYLVMAYLVMAYLVMVMAYVVMAYIVMATSLISDVSVVSWPAACASTVSASARARHRSFRSMPTADTGGGGADPRGLPSDRASTRQAPSAFADGTSARATVIF